MARELMSDGSWVIIDTPTYSINESIPIVEMLKEVRKRISNLDEDYICWAIDKIVIEKSCEVCKKIDSQIIVLDLKDRAIWYSKIRKMKDKYLEYIKPHREILKDDSSEEWFKTRKTRLKALDKAIEDAKKERDQQT